MACFRPLAAWRKPGGGVTFNKSESFGIEQKLPCGQCIGCRIAKSQEWALRCVNEASLHSENSFITLTYSPENLPPDGGLEKTDFQKFMKRLRKNSGAKIRFFHCGEYGEKLSRPHYHALLFGYDLTDKEPLFIQNGHQHYYSEFLAKTWAKGHATISDCTYESAAYCARYIQKKINGPLAQVVNDETGLRHYETIDANGEIKELPKEYTTMSRNPGIGKEWFKQYRDEIFPADEVVIRTKRNERPKKFPPPRYYASIYEHDDEKAMEIVRKARQLRARKRAKENTEARLSTRERVLKARLSKLKRPMEQM